MLKRNPSELQSETARRNGALSQGPTSSEGKLNSSQNATTHGLASNVIVLSNESPDQFLELLDELTTEFQPETKAELRVVHLRTIPGHVA